MPISQEDLFNLYKSGKISSETYNKISPPQKFADGGQVPNKNIMDMSPAAPIQMQSVQQLQQGIAAAPVTGDWNMFDKWTPNKNSKTTQTLISGGGSGPGGDPINNSAIPTGFDPNDPFGQNSPAMMAAFGGLVGQDDDNNDTSGKIGGILGLVKNLAPLALAASDGAQVGNPDDPNAQPVDFNPQITNTQDMLSLPQGQPVLAGTTSSGSAPAPNLNVGNGIPQNYNLGGGSSQPIQPSIFGGADPINYINTGLNAAKAAGDMASQSKSQGINQTTSRNDLADKAEASAYSKGQEGQNAIKEIANVTGVNTKPIAEFNENDIKQVQLDNAIQRQRVQTNLNIADDLKQAASAKLDTMAEFAKIDPEQYKNQLGISGNISTGIGMLLSGLGSGASGQPNMAMQVYQKNIDRNIDAQKANIANDFKNVAAQLGISEAYVNSASMRSSISNLAVLTVTKGADALLKAAMDKTKAQTAQEHGVLAQQANAMTISKTMNDFNAIHNGMITSGQTIQANLLGMGLMNFSKYGSFFPPDLVVQGKNGLGINLNPNAQPTQTQPTKEQQVQQQLKEKQPSESNSVSPIENIGSSIKSGFNNFLDSYNAGREQRRKENQ